MQIPGPCPQVLGFSSSGEGLEICILTSMQGDVDHTGNRSSLAV